MPPPLPPPPSYPPPLSFEQQRRRDAESLDLLAIFHFIYGGIGLFGTFIMAAYLFLIGSVFTGVMGKVAERGEAKELAGLPYFFMGFFLLIALTLAAYSMSSIACGFFLKNRRHRIFTLVMSGVHCLSVPVGTALGVWTFVVLQRDAARTLFVD